MNAIKIGDKVKITTFNKIHPADMHMINLDKVLNVNTDTDKGFSSIETVREQVVYGFTYEFKENNICSKESFVLTTEGYAASQKLFTTEVFSNKATDEELKVKDETVKVSLDAIPNRAVTSTDLSIIKSIPAPKFIRKSYVTVVTGEDKEVYTVTGVIVPSLTSNMKKDVERFVYNLKQSLLSNNIDVAKYDITYKLSTRSAHKVEVTLKEI